METLLLRADGGLHLGMGHLLRSLALAGAWMARGGKAAFLAAGPEEVLHLRIEGAGARFFPLAHSHPDPLDLSSTLELVRELKPRAVSLDGYGYDPEYQAALRAEAPRLLVIDDLGHWPRYHARFILNQNLHASRLTYLGDPDTMLLAGPSYALLRPEFLAWRGFWREIPEVARKVVVTLGGSDAENVTLHVVQALHEVVADDLEIRVVAGSANPHREALRQACAAGPRRFELLCDVGDMPALFAWGDMAVAAAGSTAWEMCLLGLPSLLLVTSENQRPIAEELDRAGAARNLGWPRQVDAKSLARAVEELIRDSARRLAMSRAGQGLVDGQGAARVAEALAGSDGREGGGDASPPPGQ